MKNINSGKNCQEVTDRVYKTNQPVFWSQSGLPRIDRPYKL